MLSNELAIALKEAGLAWDPKLHDFFLVPAPGLDDRLFVLTDMHVERIVLKGSPALTFNGATEWALDHIFVEEAIWVPTESQLRAQLESMLAGPFSLQQVPGGYTILTESGTDVHGESACDTYATALLMLLGK